MGYLAVARHGSTSTEELVWTCSSLPTCVALQSRVTTTDMDATQVSEASTSLLGPLNGKFIYKKNEDGTINKNAVICSFCKKQFSHHRSCSSLTNHLNAKHVGTSSTVTGASQAASAELRVCLSAYLRLSLILFLNFIYLSVFVLHF